MKILISGASGLIGRRLVDDLSNQGHSCRKLVRTRTSHGSQEVSWNPSEGILPESALENIDAVIHLSGENVAGGRWTKERKQAILESRVRSTKLLANVLCSLERRPKVWLCASAVGIYGNRGDDILTEDSPHGDGFLARVCKEWESATHPAREVGIRICNLRFGAVFGSEGGAFALMRTAFGLGLGGVVGPGNQWMSWIAIEDAIGAIVHLLACDTVIGPVNLVSPNPVTNRELTKTLGRVLRRPTLLPMPAFAARLALGAMADEMLLSSARVMPERLLRSGFGFHHPNVEGAMRSMVTR
ncbi:MAG: epimerase [Candidatus Hydrogenedentota bacterium]